MSFPKDKKGAVEHSPEVVTPEQEREFFGQQAPYATTSTPSNAWHSTEADPSRVIPTGIPTASSPVHPAGPQLHHYSTTQNHEAQGHPTADAPPPSYEEVAQSRAPQTNYRDALNHEGDTSPTTALLARPSANGYSSVQIPPPRPPSPSANSHSVPDPDRARRFNKFWLLFFVVVLFLLLLDNDKRLDNEEECMGRPRYTRNLTDYNILSSINEFTVTMTNMASYVVVEQAPADSDVTLTKLIVEGSGLDREDVSGITRSVTQDSDTSYKVSLTQRSDAECLRGTVKIILAPGMTSLQRLKVAINEGNLTINLLDPQWPQRIQVRELDSKVITGHSNVRANINVWGRLGSSVGTITGEILVGKELQVAMIKGDVTLNIAQSSEKNVIVSKVEVVNGNARVGLSTPFEGEFKVDTVNGSANVDPDPSRTHFTSVTNKVVKGWNSANNKAPSSPTSSLRVQTRNGNASLSMKPIEL
ncbi:hypothetical protein BGX28_004064 [Mortierella sp. GBA30]|nr:hypothetical protein BGX28_004064 [Mortierella sp. GBA30]